MQAVVTVTAKLAHHHGVVGHIAAYNALITAMTRLSEVLEAAGRCGGADWRECDLWQDEAATVLVMARTATGDEDAQQAETTIDALMVEIKGEINRRKRVSMSYHTILKTED